MSNNVNRDIVDSTLAGEQTLDGEALSALDGSETETPAVAPTTEQMPPAPIALAAVLPPAPAVAEPLVSGPGSEPSIVLAAELDVDQGLVAVPIEDVMAQAPTSPEELPPELVVPDDAPAAPVWPAVALEMTSSGPAPTETRPAGASTEVRQFIAMLRRERKVRVRVRRLKRLGWAVATAALAGYLAARSERPEASVDSLPDTLALASAQAAPADPTRTAEAPLVEMAGEATGPADPAPPGESALCEESFAQQRWRAAVETCTRVFEQTPDAAVAMRVAHAHYSRGDTGPSGFWARTALGLGSRDADAFVLIGHSERQAGHARNAAAAYRRYLQSSPRGWHAKRLRAALRELAPRPAAYRQPSARHAGPRTL
jgi:hypothetical protein